MTPEQIRLEALRLAIVDDKITVPDVSLILARASQYEAFIVGASDKAAPRPADKRQGQR